MAMAGHWLRTMFGFGDGSAAVPMALAVWVMVALVLVNLAPETWDIRFGTGLRWAPVYATALLIAYLFVNQQPTVFLYYQF
jgi:hypothetical protein